MSYSVSQVVAIAARVRSMPPADRQDRHNRQNRRRQARKLFAAGSCLRCFDLIFPSGMATSQDPVMEGGG